MRHVLALGSLVLAVAAAAVVACSNSSGDVTDGDDGGSGDEGGSSTLPPGSSSGGGSPGPAGSGLNTGLPCDVQAVLENRCIACHDGTTAVAMLSYTDLMKKSTVDPTKNLAQEAVVRMQNKSMPPAPAAPPDPDEVQAFASWVMAGTPMNPMSCTDAPPGTDGGVDAGRTDAGGDGGVTCTSGKTWTAADGFGADMRPGEACNACHQIQGGPNLRIAGTVYPTLHEPNDCLGSKAPPTLTVIITDRNNKIFNLTVSGTSGNFQTAPGEKPAAPFRAKVTNGTTTRSMVGSVTSGDCNSCHTVTGKNAAPGRIEAP